MKKENCIFCHQEKLHIVLSNKLAVAFFDIHPVSKGHLLVIPNQHRPTYFDLTNDELLAMNDLLHQGKKMLDDKFHPDGYNIGINVGHDAGQEIMHCHFHLIPRYHGDVPNPLGGIKNMLPEAK